MNLMRYSTHDRLYKQREMYVIGVLQKLEGQFLCVFHLLHGTTCLIYSESIGYFLYISAVKRCEIPNRRINLMVNHQEWWNKLLLVSFSMFPIQLSFSKCWNKTSSKCTKKKKRCIFRLLDYCKLNGQERTTDFFQYQTLSKFPLAFNLKKPSYWDHHYISVNVLSRHILYM